MILIFLPIWALSMLGIPPVGVDPYGGDLPLPTKDEDDYVLLDSFQNQETWHFLVAECSNTLNKSQNKQFHIAIADHFTKQISNLGLITNVHVNGPAVYITFFHITRGNNENTNSPSFFYKDFSQFGYVSFTGSFDISNDHYFNDEGDIITPIHVHYFVVHVKTPSFEPVDNAEEGAIAIPSTIQHPMIVQIVHNIVRNELIIDSNAIPCEVVDYQIPKLPDNQVGWSIVPNRLYQILLISIFVFILLLSLFFFLLHSRKPRVKIEQMIEPRYQFENFELRDFLRICLQQINDSFCQGLVYSKIDYDSISQSMIIDSPTFNSESNDDIASNVYQLGQLISDIVRRYSIKQSGLLSDLLFEMLLPNSLERPYPSEALTHPFFMNSPQKLDVYKKASYYLNIPHYKVQILNFEKGKSLIISGSWITILTIIGFSPNDHRHRYDPTLKGLIKFIDNKWRHRDEECNNSLILKSEDDYLTFFDTTFPNLFLYTYYWLDSLINC